METLDAVISFALLLLLLVTGCYGMWHSATAEEFIARKPHTGSAKYRYHPKWYHRTLHFTVSLIFLVVAIFASAHFFLK